MEHVLHWSGASAVFWVATAAWLAEPFFFSSRRTSAGATERRSRRERLAMAAGILGAFALAAALDRLGIGGLSGPAARALRVGGLALYTGGAVLRYLSARALGAAFTRDVRVATGQELVEAGPYRVLRHPLYVGLFALGLGLVAQFANPLALAIGAVLVAVPIALRARREERLLRAALPGRYPAWCARRPRLLPGLF